MSSRNYKEKTKTAFYYNTRYRRQTTKDSNREEFVSLDQYPTRKVVTKESKRNKVVAPKTSKVVAYPWYRSTLNPVEDNNMASGKDPSPDPSVSEPSMPSGSSTGAIPKGSRVDPNASTAEMFDNFRKNMMEINQRNNLELAQMLAGALEKQLSISNTNNQHRPRRQSFDNRGRGRGNNRRSLSRSDYEVPLPSFNEPPRHEDNPFDDFAVPNNRRWNNLDFPNNAGAHSDVRLDKWGIQKWDGKNMQVDDFLFAVECSKLNSSYSWDQVYKNFAQLLDSPMTTFYWRFRNLNREANFNLFKDRLSKEFGSTESDTAIWKKMLLRKQRINEPFKDFFSNLQEMRLRLKVPKPDNEMMELIIENVNFDMSRMVFRANYENLQELIELCIEADRVLQSHQFSLDKSRAQFPKKYVNEICQTECNEGELEESVESLRQGRNFNTPRSGPTRLCWNCECDGHFSKNCPSPTRRLHCFRCGKVGVTTPNCSNCNNFLNRRGPQQTGMERDTQSNPEN